MMYYRWLGIIRLRKTNDIPTGQIIKYGFVGGLNFLFTAAFYWFLLHKFLINYTISFILSWVSGVLLTYILNFLWVFKPEEVISFKKRFWKYLLIYLLSFTANLLILKLGINLFGFDPYYFQLLLIPLVVMINFIGIKYWA